MFLYTLCENCTHSIITSCTVQKDLYPAEVPLPDLCVKSRLHPAWHASNIKSTPITVSVYDGTAYIKYKELYEWTAVKKLAPFCEYLCSSCDTCIVRKIHASFFPNSSMILRLTAFHFGSIELCNYWIDFGKEIPKTVFIFEKSVSHHLALLGHVFKFSLSCS